MLQHLSPTGASTSAANPYVPRGYGPDWVWRRLRVYLSAIVIACAVLGFWVGLAGRRFDWLLGAIVLGAVALSIALAPVRNLSEAMLGRARVSARQGLQAGGAAAVLTVMGAIALRIIWHTAWLLPTTG